MQVCYLGHKRECHLSEAGMSNKRPRYGDTHIDDQLNSVVTQSSGKSQFPCVSLVSGAIYNDDSEDCRSHS